MKYPKGELILRDHLAADRTKMSNERTLLSYIRTFIMIIVSGITVIKVFPKNETLIVIGAILIPISIALLGTGIYRYFRVREEIKELYRK
jgi:putative membrane protein